MCIWQPMRVRSVVVGAFAQDHVHVIRSATIAGRNPVALLKTFWSLWQGNLDSANSSGA